MAVAVDAQQSFHAHVLFREVNNRLNDLDVEGLLPAMILVCECADLGCIETVELTRCEYAAVRRVPDRFVVAAGCASRVAEVERVVEEHERFCVVESAP
jgi:hypothetical protein